MIPPSESLAPAELAEQAERFFSGATRLRRSHRLVPYFCPDRSLEGTRLTEARAWRRRVFDAGFGWLDGPPELGGRGLGIEHVLAFREVELRYEVPDDAPYFGISLQMVAPAIDTYGSRRARTELLPALYRGDLIACQLFSEADAGSDLAAVSTVARRDPGGGWIVDGEKWWSTGAHFSDLGLVLARLAPGEPEAAPDTSRRHDGLIALLVPLDQPGVTVERLEQPPGSASFCRVGFTAARAPEHWCLGQPGLGWLVAMGTLSGERGSIGLGATRMSALDPRVLLDLAQRYGDPDDTGFMERLGETLALLYATDWTAQRAAIDHAESGLPSAAGLAAKLAVGDSFMAVAGLASELMDDRIGWGGTRELSNDPQSRNQDLRSTDPDMTDCYGQSYGQESQELAGWRSLVQSAHVFKIAGGTDQVVTSVLAEQFLGLSR